MRAMFLFIVLFTCGSAAAQPAPDDAVLADLYTACLDSLVPRPAGGRPVTIALSFDPGIVSSETMRTLTEVFLTSRGYALADPGSFSAQRIRIAVPDARTTIRREHGRFRRVIQLSVHIRSMDADGTIISAGGTGLSRSDTIAGAEIRRTDTASRFSPSITRRDSGGGPGGKVLVSFLVFAAAIGWFGYK